MQASVNPWPTRYLIGIFYQEYFSKDDTRYNYTQKTHAGVQLHVEQQASPIDQLAHCLASVDANSLFKTLRLLPRIAYPTAERHS